ncbi:alpha/beta fold hydrolase [Parafrankia sp. BMG5.11]|uniref:alpha/beta fold hydrolase n=1 Tax=Parafrankia sp. BMG5.11 TaxID=222540 RepID=UPI00103E18E7|nr:alpha/beta hydrolase [Parafrankia sp. BMG5.11]TCJ35919.1 alpha/beta hydrolase [Parafrankia sp. BMG5.11]
MIRLAYEIFGDGPTILLVHGGAEDAAMLAPQALALAATGWRAVVYDRRGTGASTRDGWPGGGVDQHADDAADLIRELARVPSAFGGSGSASGSGSPSAPGAPGAPGRSGPVTVLGFSSGGVVAMALAGRHPDLVAEAIAWEPAAIGVLPDGAAAHAEIMKPIEEYTARRPGDWTGAYHRALEVLSGGTADLTDPAVIRSAVNAEAFVRDDARLITSHPFAAADLPPDRITVAVGAGTSPLHRLIADRLAEWADLPVTTVAGADDHEVHLSRPEVLATHLAERAARAGGPVS